MTQTQTVPNDERVDKIMTDIYKAIESQEIVNHVTDVIENAWSTDNLIPSAKWSISNRLVLAMNDTQDARTFKHWESVGRSIKSGAKAVYIRSPRHYKFKNDKDEEEKGMYFTAHPVFRKEDTTGQAIAESIPKELPPLYDLAGHNSIEVSECPSNIVQEDSWLRDSMSYLPDDELKAFLCELASEYNQRFMIRDTSDMETEAIVELSACVLTNLYHANTLKISQDYINAQDGKSKSEIGEAYIKVLNRVENVVHSILVDAEKIQTRKY